MLNSPNFSTLISLFLGVQGFRGWQPGNCAVVHFTAHIHRFMHSWRSCYPAVQSLRNTTIAPLWQLRYRTNTNVLACLLTVELQLYLEFLECALSVLCRVVLLISWLRWVTRQFCSMWSDSVRSRASGISQSDRHARQRRCQASTSIEQEDELARQSSQSRQHSVVVSAVDVSVGGGQSRQCRCQQRAATHCTDLATM